MDSNIELLNSIYQNSEMGKDTIEKLLDIAEDDHMLSHLQDQRDEYTEINDKARMLLHNFGHKEEDIGALTKLTSDLSLRLSTLKDRSPSHIADMMIQGSTMGVIDATKNIRRHADADGRVVNLAHQLLDTEQNNVETMKHFL